MSPTRLLLIQANPPDGIPLALDVEQRNLQEAIEQSGGRAEFEIHVLPAGRIDDIPRYLRRYVPHIVHFACHGDGDGGLRLSAPGDRSGEVLAVAHLAAIVRDYQAEAPERLRVAVLAGCNTDETAHLMVEHIDCAVGFADDVDDEDLLQVFTPQLYAALGDGRSVPNAVDTACGVLRGRGRDGTAELVRIHRRAGIADSDLRLTAWTPTVLSPAHMDYLKMWFGKPWVDVSLADIVGQNGGGRRAPLLDIYVPLKVDFALDIQVQDGKIVDWWARTEQAERAAEAARRIPGNAGHEDESLHEHLQVHQRAWPALGAGEVALQGIVDDIQVTIDKRRAAGETTKDGEHSWYMEAHDAASVQPRFVLLGEPGSGKSSFLRHLALCVAGELRRRTGDAAVPANASLAALRDWLLDAYTPMYVELRELVRAVFPPLPANPDAPLLLPEVEDFWRYVRESGGGQLAASGGELRRLCDEGGALLLLDGLDEVPQADTKQRRIQIQALLGALAKRYPHLRIVVAGRPHAYRRGEWALDGFGVAELRALSLSRLSELAHALFPIIVGADGAQQADSFIAAVERQLKDRRIETSFYRNPLFFTLLAGLWLDPISGQRLPETRAALYRHAVDLLLSRWTRRRLPDASIAENLGLTPDRLRSVLETLACSVHERSEPNEDTTRFAVKELLGVLYDTGCEVRVRDVPDYLSQHTGLLTSPEHGWLYFTHRSFQEHLAACELICAEPDLHVPPVAEDRRFRGGLVQRMLARPDLWENVARLAADELVVKNRKLDLGRLLGTAVRPYLEQEQSGGTVLLVLEIAREQGLFAADPDDRELNGSDFKDLRDAALKVLVDWENFEPEQRNVAGEQLGSRPEYGGRRGVGLRADSLPDIAWVEVPEADAQGRREFIYQKGERRVEPTFWMARYPLTYAQFQAFVDAEDGYRDARWWEGLDAPEDVRKAPGEQSFQFWNHPREGVDWYAAVAFCRWLSWQAEEKRDLLPPALRRRSDWRISLPAEWQWEKAARGHDGRQYPWGGDEYRRGFANINEAFGFSEYKPGDESGERHNLRKTSAVGMYPQGASPYGICDLSGNVWEWCLNEYENPEHTQEDGPEHRILRGGSWYNSSGNAAAVTRNWNYPLNRLNHVGFRVVVVCVVPVS